MQAVLTAESVRTPIGAFLLVVDGEGVPCAAEFADCEVRLRKLLERRFGAGRYALARGLVPENWKAGIGAYFAGQLGAIDTMPIKTGGTAFQQIVWTALRSISPGIPIAYSELARRLRKPQSARAVGHANGSNPLSIIVPCHRLVGAGGSLVRYGGGIERKRWLLDHEARFAKA